MDLLTSGWLGVRSVAVAGNARAGKTFLTDTVVRRAVDRGWSVAVATAVRHERTVPFAAVAGALVQILGAQASRLIDTPTPSDESARAAWRQSLYDVLRSELDGQAGPLLIVIDDLQCADPESQGFLRSLLQWPLRRQVLVVVAYRPGEMTGAELRATVHTLRRAHQWPLPSAVAGLRAPLTQREWQIAELVADGYTNRRIAEMLLLSGRTVERHLSRIFTKLDITTRVTLAALVVQANRRWPLPADSPGAAVSAIRSAGKNTAIR
ncbi:LuxR C-terminal-related transcriptional regulator [Kribbella sp. NBC_01505]|uniref:LuxR C-terminal-related transcriptional regulator n=1 Tax=Kribbella sp. NBC_01505 TaxID=2903580 RepID=UPI003865BCE7